LSETHDGANEGAIEGATKGVKEKLAISTAIADV